MRIPKRLSPWLCRKQHRLLEPSHLRPSLGHAGQGFAPKAGAETRRDVARYAKRAQVQATRFSRAVQSGMHDVVERGKALVHKKDKKSVPEAA